MSLFPQPSRSLQPSRPPRSSSSSHSSRSSSSSHSRSLFEQVLESTIENVTKNCTSVETRNSSNDMSSTSSSSGGNSSYNGGSCNNVLTGGVDLMIKLEDFRVYIVLLHGLINTQSQPISSLDITKVPLMAQTQSFPASITNLACISAAPTGIVNIGGRYTLYTFEQFINAKVSKIFEKYIRGTLPTMIKNKLIESIQTIENKANKVTDKTDEDTDTKKKKISSESTIGIIFHRVCNYCFRISKPTELITNFLSKIFDFVTSVLPTGINFNTPLLDGKILGYSLKDIDKFEFNICKSVFSKALQGGAERVIEGGTGIGTKRAQSSGPGHPQNPLCAVSTDLFVLLLDNLRESLKKFDVGPFTEYCKNIKVQNIGSNPTETQKYNVASNTIDKRFRNLSILKGFGVSQNIQYINKDMMYNHSKDKHLGMGLIELSFKLDHNNKVRCVTRKLHPFDVIKGIGAKGKVSSTADQTEPLNIDKMSHWIKMQDCIDYLHETGDQNPDKTVLLIDLSCSGYSGGVASTAYACGQFTGVNYPGGGGPRGYYGKKSHTRSKKRSNAKSRACSRTRSNKRTIITSVNSKYRRNIRRHITQNRYKIKK